MFVLQYLTLRCRRIRSSRLTQCLRAPSPLSKRLIIFHGQRLRLDIGRLPGEDKLHLCPSEHRRAAKPVHPLTPRQRCRTADGNESGPVVGARLQGLRSSRLTQCLRAPIALEQALDNIPRSAPMSGYRRASRGRQVTTSAPPSTGARRSLCTPSPRDRGVELPMGTKAAQ
jgi:hypothetical protein